MTKNVTEPTPFEALKSSPEALIEDARNGRMFILVDDEDRENEGDLVIPAQMATPDAINFMATHGRGLICLAMERQRIEALGLPLMARTNEGRFHTAFTVSIEAREGVTTGISAPDRARTIAVAIDPARSPDEIVTPGHVFPLVARDGGTLVRAGHTEAAVDSARLAGLNPSGVICEIMNDDGTMARRDDLIAFAQRHGLKIGTIADLIAYRLNHDRTVVPRHVSSFSSLFGGEFDMKVYRDSIDQTEHVVLTKGDPANQQPALVRVHALNVLQDVLGDASDSRIEELHASMRIIAEEGTGVIVLIREPMLRRELAEDRLSEESEARLKLPETDLEGTSNARLRNYGVGAQILLDLGVHSMTLLTNGQVNIPALKGYGLTVAGTRPIDTPSR